MNRPSSQPITKRQIIALQTARRHAGLDDEAYHTMMERDYGVSSTSLLTRRQATVMLTRFGLKHTQKKAVPRKQAAAPIRQADNLVRLATVSQRTLIARLVSQVSWRVADGYRSWLHARFGLDRVITLAQASQVIEGLKGMIRHEK